MTIKTLTVVAALVSTLLAAPLKAETLAAAPLPSMTAAASPLTSQLPIFAPAPMLAQSVLPTELGSFSAKAAPIAVNDAGAKPASVSNAVADADDADEQDDSNDLRKTLITLAMRLRDTRYVRGGHDPSTGFDCSGFVRYVFSRALGLHLPTNSASQFLSGLKVKRSDMQPGDLVFFRTAGRRGHGRVSHVGIYIDNGQFIHSPSHGKTVRVDNLADRYWAKRFAGAKRPDGMAQIDAAERNG
jgi:cell wall-associated NlpC family hydrolase